MEDPEGHLVKKGIPIRMELGPGATITKDDIKVGARKMLKAKRDLWLADIESGEFWLVRTDAASADAQGPVETNEDDDVEEDDEDME